MGRLDVVTASIIRVGDGRGFVIERRADRLIVTAAHCLPSFPPCMSFSDLHDRTYQGLLAPIGDEPLVWTECLFVDPIGDIALLGPPDAQELSDQWDPYNKLV